MRRVAENFPLKFIILDTTISFVYEQSQVNKFQLVVDGTPFDYLVAEMRSDVISISNSLESYLDPQSARSKSQSSDLSSLFTRGQILPSYRRGWPLRRPKLTEMKKGWNKRWGCCV